MLKLYDAKGIGGAGTGRGSFSCSDGTPEKPGRERQAIVRFSIKTMD
jgi:hypothetical protein